MEPALKRTLLFVMGMLLAATFVAGALKLIEKKNNDNLYNEIIAHETEYKIYMNGAVQDSETFKIETLTRKNYTFELDRENKTIVINRTVYSLHRHPDYDIFD